MRSKLFVPGSRPELFAKALASEADAISIDLEDAVDESRKAEARAATREFLSGLSTPHAKTMIVRINGLDSPHFRDDIEAIVGSGADLINLPMVESAEQVRRATAEIERVEAARGLPATIRLLPNVETPRGLRLAHEIAAAGPRVAGLQLGFGDLLEPLGIERYNPAVILHFQLALRLAAGEAGVFAYDSAWAHVKDMDGFRREAETARRLGFLGKSAIHPSQVAVINEVFRPSDAEIAHALRVVESAREARAKGLGAWTIDGRMIDAPFVVRAEATLAIARRLNLLPA